MSAAGVGVADFVDGPQQQIAISSNLEPTKFVILRIFGPNFGQIWQFWCFWKAEIEIYPNLAKLNWEEIQILSKSRIWV